MFYFSNTQQNYELFSLKEKVRFLEQERSKFIEEWNRSTDTKKELEENARLEGQFNWSNHTENELKQVRAKVRDLEQEHENLKQLLIGNKNEELSKTLREDNDRLPAEIIQVQNAHVSMEKENGDLASG